VALTRVQDIVLDSVSRPVPGASVAVLTQPATATTQPGSPLASIFQDSAGLIPMPNPTTTDGLGNYDFYVAAGVYTLQIYGNKIYSATSPQQLLIPDLQVALLVTPSTASAGQFVSGMDANGNLLYGTPTNSTVVVNTNAQSGTSYTVLNSDQGKLVTFNNASAIAVTLPQAGASGLFTTGWFAYFENIGSGTVTISPAVSTIDGLTSLVLAQNSGAIIVSNGTNYSTMRGVGATTNTVNALELTGSTGLPAATGTNLWIGGNFGTPHLGKIFIGDGTGWQIDFSKRVGSVTTDIFGFKDNGVVTFSSPSTGTLQAGISSPSAGILAIGASGAANDTGGAARATTFSQTPDNGTTNHARMDATGIAVGSGDLIRISSTTTASGTPDCAFSRMNPGNGQVALGSGSATDRSGRLFQNLANANLTSTTVAGVTVQTTLGTITTLTQELNAVGSWITVKARGYHSTGATAGTITYKLAVGGTNLITLGAFSPAANLPNNAWYLEFDVMVQTAGATGALEVQCNSVLNNIGTNAFFNTATIPNIDVTGTVTFTLSITPTQTTTSSTCRMMGYQRNN
jgi:hypothetical protein